MSIDVNPQENSRCGYVAIVGRPNVGKSTLLNHILGQKISITSKKPQTTRHQILGIKTEGDYQAIYVDTPGLHQLDKKALNRVLNKASSSAIKDADVIVFVVDRKRWTEEDDYVLSKIAKVNRPRILVINKVDKLENKDDLLPFIDKVQKMCEFQHIIPLSALRGLNIDRLEAVINEMLPQGIHFFPEDQITDRSERFMAVEIIREKVMRQLGNEVPYEIAVEIEQFKREGALLRISALILVEREGQKKIVIGQKGERIKRIGSDARKDMEKLFESKVMLETWVKVKSGWSDNERALQSLGYDDR
ncbi:GTP-binding protein Era [Hahella chejuensis KCTC 2396]|uniref:GTPase Era n=1 Tax=Hahella chejuensis (strain KCTC 2396) TaxID=349521 RepID=Q2SL31_HAHCH|nr:GTPase Era [Hahella chejuensis]ABC28643.1 GTP-binding protein Era [Hahella chejuensis KCTC 2396]